VLSIDTVSTFNNIRRNTAVVWPLHVTRQSAPVKNCRTWLEQNYTGCMPLLAATSSVVLGRTHWSSAQLCCLQCLRTNSVNYFNHQITSNKLDYFLKVSTSIQTQITSFIQWNYVFMLFAKSWRKVGKKWRLELWDVNELMLWCPCHCHQYL